MVSSLALLLINESKSRRKRIVKRRPIPSVTAGEIDTKGLRSTVRLSWKIAGLEDNRMLFTAGPFLDK